MILSLKPVMLSFLTEVLKVEYKVNIEFGLLQFLCIIVFKYSRVVRNCSVASNVLTLLFNSTLNTKSVNNALIILRFCGFIFRCGQSSFRLLTVVVGIRKYFASLLIHCSVKRFNRFGNILFWCFWHSCESYSWCFLYGDAAN